MAIFRITTVETLYTFYEMDIPDDIPADEWEQYFYENHKTEDIIGTDSEGFEIDSYEEIKDDN